MPEFDLMKRYPRTERKDLISKRTRVSAKDRKIAQKFGKEYFDGPRHLGMGGYKYDPKFFTPVVEDMVERYHLNVNSRVLDVGCGKGFMLHDLRLAVRGINICGIDISDYCLENSMDTVRPFLKKGSCDNLPYPDKSFDCVISIATIHNLYQRGVQRSIEEMIRVVKNPKNCFIKVNGYRTMDEKYQLNAWNLVAKTILPVCAWETMFNTLGYKGDYSFFTP